MAKTDVVKAEIRVGSGVLSIRRKGNSDVTTARILGFELADDGETVSLWLDRLLHTMSEDKIGDEADPWRVDGSFVSVLSKRLSQDELNVLRMGTGIGGSQTTDGAVSEPCDHAG